MLLCNIYSRKSPDVTKVLQSEGKIVSPFCQKEEAEVLCGSPPEGARVVMLPQDHWGRLHPVLGREKGVGMQDQTTLHNADIRMYTYMQILPRLSPIN